MEGGTMNEVEQVPLTPAERCARSRAKKRGEFVLPRSYPTGMNNHAWRGGTQAKICLKCGSIFLGPRWELKDRKYCSKQCYWEARIDPSKRRIRIHDKIVERVLGKILPSNAVVHHINGHKKDNVHSNLIICQNQGYHLLLHSRKRILDAGGDPSTDKICSKCHEVKPKSEFHSSRRGDGHRCYCRPCQAIYAYERRSNGNLN
jgi:hypothetical protein